MSPPWIWRLPRERREAAGPRRGQPTPRPSPSPAPAPQPATDEPVPAFQATAPGELDDAIWRRGDQGSDQRADEADLQPTETRDAGPAAEGAPPAGEPPGQRPPDWRGEPTAEMTSEDWTRLRDLLGEEEEEEDESDFPLIEGS